MTELILSLDVLDRKRACAIAESCAPFIDAIKVGYPLVLSTGLTIVEDLAGLALPLIADFKVADIPNTNRLICEAVFSAGFDAVIAHGFVGADAARTCVEVAHNHSGAAYIVAEMSHPGATEFFHDGVAERLAPAGPTASSPPPPARNGSAGSGRSSATRLSTRRAWGHRVATSIRWPGWSTGSSWAGASTRQRGRRQKPNASPASAGDEFSVPIPAGGDDEPYECSEADAAHPASEGLYILLQILVS